MSQLSKCLKAARELTRDPSAVRKSDFPNVDQFDEALIELADSDWRDDETYASCYKRAWESEDGQLLYTAREMAPRGVKPIEKRHIKINKHEQRIFNEVFACKKRHPDWSNEKALLHVLEANPRLYTEN